MVKLIFKLFLDGYGKGTIAAELNKLGIPAYFGGKWCGTSVLQILRNYDYTGNMILQKTYTKDFISKKTMINNGEKPKYHVEDSHEAIIDLDTYLKVQVELQRRRSLFTDRNNHSIYKGKIKCGCCGKSLLRKVSPYRTFWICATYQKGGVNACPSKRIDEEELISILEEIQLATKRDIHTSIKQIIINHDHTLEVIFDDKFRVTRPWQERSRSKSWTEEMREKVSQRETERWKLRWQRSQ